MEILADALEAAALSARIELLRDNPGKHYATWHICLQLFVEIFAELQNVTCE